MVEVEAQPKITAAEIMGRLDLHAENLRNQAKQEAFHVVKIATPESQNESAERFNNILDIAYKAAEKEQAKKDGLTGLYLRGEFVRFLELVRAEGIKKIKCTVCDMNFLKDHNINLGEPFGGDLALAAMSQVLRDVMKERGAVGFRMAEAGGDDFLIVEIADDDGKSLTPISQLIEAQLKSIKPDDYLSGRIGDKNISRHDDEGKKSILLDEEQVQKLREKPDLLAVIIPPNGTMVEFLIEPQNDVIYKKQSDNTKKVECGTAFDKFKQAMAKVSQEKKEWLGKFQVEHPLTAAKLARQVAPKQV